jgi:hypothetical protein
MGDRFDGIGTNKLGGRHGLVARSSRAIDMTDNRLNLSQVQYSAQKAVSLVIALAGKAITAMSLCRGGLIEAVIWITNLMAVQGGCNHEHRAINGQYGKMCRSAVPACVHANPGQPSSRP